MACQIENCHITSEKLYFKVSAYEAKMFSAKNKNIIFEMHNSKFEMPTIKIVYFTSAQSGACMAKTSRDINAWRQFVC